jgi:glycerol kinase
VTGAGPSSLLVLDAGTSSVRAAIVRPDGIVEHVCQESNRPDVPFPGLVEFDATALATVALRCARAALAAGGPVGGVGITNQRASTIVWDRATGQPAAPALGWQDLRTLGDCLALQAEGLRFNPNQSATKLAHLLDQVDPDRSRDLCFGTVDTWLGWQLSEGAVHVTDHTNAFVTGLVDPGTGEWDPAVLERLRIPASCLPAIVDTVGMTGTATALEGRPPLAARAGDQQASLAGQSCLEPGQAKITFGTGGMLDVVVGPAMPAFGLRGERGCFPVAARSHHGTLTWAVEAMMLAAGTNVDWLCDDLGLIGSAAESHDVASRCDDAGGVVYVPAPVGLGAPYWDFGARGTLLGLTTGIDRPRVVRAVLEGVAQRGADLVEAAEGDAGVTIPRLRIDGGMSTNPTFVQALADAAGRPVEVSAETEATTLGAGFLAGLAVGTWGSEAEVGAAWRPQRVVEPAQALDRDQWREACRRAGGWIPDLSALEF